MGIYGIKYEWKKKHLRLNSKNNWRLTSFFHAARDNSPLKSGTQLQKLQNKVNHMRGALKQKDSRKFLTIYSKNSRLTQNEHSLGWEIQKAPPPPPP